MYAIDLGKVLNVNASDVRELMPSLRSMPPLCFCITLDSCNSACKSEEYGNFVEGTIGICKISMLSLHFFRRSLCLVDQFSGILDQNCRVTLENTA